MANSITPSAPQKRTGLTGAIIAIVVMVAAVAAAAFFFKPKAEVPTPAAPAPTTQVRVFGLSMYERNRERWVRDVAFFTERANQLGADVIVEYADSDAARQEQQAKSMLARGAEVLVVAPFDSAIAAPIVDAAHKAGVKVIAYDRMINSASLDYYVSFDSVQVGRQQAQGVLDAVPAKSRIAYLGGDKNNTNAFLLKQGSSQVLDPKIANGDVTLVIDTFVTGWSTEEAYNILKAYLKSGGKLDGVVGANDTIAQGAITALKEFGLGGKVAVSGQDADLAGMRSLVEGTQTVDVYKPIKALAYEAAEMASAIVSGKAVVTTGSLSNGIIDVPAVIIPTVAVTKDNIDATVVADGFYTHDEIFNPATP